MDVNGQGPKEWQELLSFGPRPFTSIDVRFLSVAGPCVRRGLFQNGGGETHLKLFH